MRMGAEPISNDNLNTCAKRSTHCFVFRQKYTQHTLDMSQFSLQLSYMRKHVDICLQLVKTPCCECLQNRHLAAPLVTCSSKCPHNSPIPSMLHQRPAVQQYLKQRKILFVMHGHLYVIEVFFTEPSMGIVALWVQQLISRTTCRYYIQNTKNKWLNFEPKHEHLLIRPFCNLDSHLFWISANNLLSFRCCGGLRAFCDKMNENFT